MPEVTLHDRSTIEVQVHGQGPALLLPVNPRPVQALGPRSYGAGATTRRLAAR